MKIFIDFETTGLLEPKAKGAAAQPYAIEFYGVVYTDDMEEKLQEYECMIKPPVPISPEITKITGITNDDLADKDPFIQHLDALQDLFLGVTTLVAHNAQYDKGILQWELERLNAVTKFPWPPVTVCTVEQSTSLKRHRLKLIDLYEMATGKRYDDKAHRAKDDVEALVVCYRWLREKGLII